MTMSTGLRLAVAVAGGVAGAAALLGGCTQGAAPTAADPADWRTQVVELADAHGPVALPSRLPAQLAEAQPVTLEGQPAVTFRVPGEPLVTICSGDLTRCRGALGSSREVRTGRADGVAFVVALGAREQPGSTPTLSASGQSFWADVAMTSARPDWLAASGSR